MTLVELCDRLQALCPRHALRIKIHENRSAYATVRRSKGGIIDLSIHRLFLYSSTPVLQALAGFALNRDAKARFVMRQMAHLYFTRINPPAPDHALSDTQGKHVDLQIIYDEQNRSFFDGQINVPIAWFAKPNYRFFRRLTFGSYDRTVPLIRVNRLLDHPEVPLLFVEFIVYHEMLHTVCEARFDQRGHLWVHTPEFRRREAQHPHYAFAKKWEQQSIKFFKGL